MRVHAFIFNWEGNEPNAVKLEKAIGKLTRVTVINSQEGLELAHSHWVHLDDSAYFSAQWNRAVEICDADLFFHIQADASFDDFASLFRRIEQVFRDHPVGVYEPNVDYTRIKFDTSQLTVLESELFVVPMTDCTCWCIDREVIADIPKVDLSVNKFGWGICRAVAAIAQLHGKYCVRDYSFMVNHPRSRGYSSEAAQRDRNEYIRSLDPEIRQQIASTDHAIRSALVEQPRNLVKPWRRILRLDSGRRSQPPL